MIRRDYILRMIAEFMEALARIRSLKQGQHWKEFSAELDAEFKKLMGHDAPTVARLSETELLALLVQGGPTYALQDKTLVLTTLLHEAGDAAAVADRMDESRECYLKALNLLLDTLARGETFECPEFVPKIEILLAALREVVLPIQTHAKLMQHYERTGEFAKAEDALFAMLDAEPENHAIVEFGLAFYQRLLSQGDAALNAANLPRAEVQEGLTELQRRRKPKTN
jgi:hypothetical protein